MVSSTNQSNSNIPVDTVPTIQSPSEDTMSKEARMARVYRVASELLSTEEQYVTVLYLIDQVSFFFVFYVLHNEYKYRVYQL